jgi:hypothetical protein
METVLIKKKQPNKKVIVKFLLLFGICALVLKRDRHIAQNDKNSESSKGA